MALPKPILALVLLATLAGCASQPATPGTADPATPSDGSGAEPGSAPASGSPPVPPSGVPPSPPGSAPAKQLDTVSVNVDGKLCPASAGAPSEAMVGPCLVVGGTAVQERWFHLDIEGTVVGADLTMTWTPSPGASTALELAFSPVESVTGGERMTEERQSVSGDSPLRLQLSDLKWKGGAYTVAAWWGGDVAYTPAGQDFHIEGTITFHE